MLLVCGISCHLYLRMHQRTGLITCDIWWFILTTIFKVAGYFSTECVRSVEEHTHNTWNKLDRSRVIPHSFTTNANTPLLFEMRVCFTEWHCSSWSSRVVRDCLIVFRILDSMSFTHNHLPGIWSRFNDAILSAFYFVQVILSIQFSIHLE